MLPPSENCLMSLLNRDQRTALTIKYIKSVQKNVERNQLNGSYNHSKQYYCKKDLSSYMNVDDSLSNCDRYLLIRKRKMEIKSINRLCLGKL